MLTPPLASTPLRVAGCVNVKQLTVHSLGGGGTDDFFTADSFPSVREGALLQLTAFRVKHQSRDNNKKKQNGTGVDVWLRT